MVPPGADRVEVGGERAHAVRVEPGGELLAFQLGFPPCVEHLGHRQRDEDRIFRFPGLRPVEEQGELGG
jgi:hypothetical protein